MKEKQRRGKRKKGCRKDGIKGQLQGSFTIEAAVVVPMTMLIFLAVIFLTFFVHDQVTLTAAVQYGVLVQAERSLMGTAPASGMEAGIESRILAASAVSCPVNGNADHCEGEGTAAFHIPLLMISQLTSGALRQLHAEAEGNAFDGRKKLLLYKSICDGAGDLLNTGK